MRVLFLLLCAVTAAAQTQTQTQTPANTTLELDGTQQRPVLLTPSQVIRATDEPLPQGLTPIQRAIQSRGRIYNNFLGVQLSVVLNLNGRVESAKPIDGPQRFYDQAVEIEMHRAFEPVEDKNGTIVRAHFTDYVAIEPPEQWLDHAPPFPERVDLKTFRIALERTGCFGSCPSYKVAIAGNGQVTWEGDSGVVVPGTHHASISREAVQQMVDQVRVSRILNALDKYEAGWTDNPAYTVTLEMNGLHKQVLDYIGPIVGMPTSIRELEGAIDRIAGTDKWINGTADLMAALIAEHWNFAAASKDNLQLYDATLQHGNRELLAAFTAARGAVFSADPAIESPACIASGFSDSHYALTMLATVPKDHKIPQHELDACLVSAARGGNAELVDLWLKGGASLDPAPLPESDDVYVPQLDHPLSAAILSGSPDIVQRLLDAHAPLDPAHNGGRNLITFAVQRCFRNTETILKILLNAGADPNTETENDKPALFTVTEPELVPLLVAGGAQVNHRDEAGNTPLMSESAPNVLRALLDAGADPTLRNPQGKTAAELWRTIGAKDAADLLDAAVKGQLVQPVVVPATASSRNAPR